MFRMVCWAQVNRRTWVRADRSTTRAVVTAFHYDWHDVASRVRKIHVGDRAPGIKSSGDQDQIRAESF